MPNLLTQPSGGARSATDPNLLLQPGPPEGLFVNNYVPSTAEYIGSGARAGLEKLGVSPRTAQSWGDKAQTGWEFTPMGAAEDAGYYLGHGNKTGAALAALGAIPGVGTEERAAVKGAEAAPALLRRPGLPASVGLLDNPSVMFEGVSPHDFTSTEQWHRFGNEYGVPNLGSPNEAEWKASLAPFTTSKGQEFTVPGGVGDKSPFTYYDLLHLKSQGINPNDIPPALHQAIHDRMLATMSQGEMTPERIMNQLILAQISPNQPLSPNELAVARTMVKGPEDLKQLGDMIPWRYNDPDAEAKASEIVGTKDIVSKKTGETKTKNLLQREQLSGIIADKLGLGAASKGGLGARGTADYTRIAETAQRMQDDPEFFRFRGAGEGGGEDPNDPRNWSNFVERLSNQTPGLSSKTGSFGGVWQNPAEANISAVDRHMAGKFTADMFPSPQDYEAFKTASVNKYNKETGKGINDYDALPDSFKNDAMFGYLNNNPTMKYRMQPAKGSNSGVGAVNPRVPEHLQPDQANWIQEPESVSLISEPYQRVLEANAKAANEAGQSIFGSQWMLWDRIRNRLEPHEIMFPGLEKVPRMSMDQMRTARKEMSDAGYMSGTKEFDEEGNPIGLQPVRPMSAASRAAYFSLPPLVAGGGVGLSLLRQPDQQPQYGGT
jgi:hypothetical protein